MWSTTASRATQHVQNTVHQKRLLPPGECPAHEPLLPLRSRNFPATQIQALSRHLRVLLRVNAIITRQEATLFTIVLSLRWPIQDLLPRLLDHAIQQAILQNQRVASGLNNHPAVQGARRHAPRQAAHRAVSRAHVL